MRFADIDKKYMERFIGNFSQKEIAEIFSCSPSHVSEVISSKYQLKKPESNKLIYESVPLYRTKGAWLNSKERQIIKSLKNE